MRGDTTRVLEMLGIHPTGGDTTIDTGFGPIRFIGHASIPIRYLTAAWDMLIHASEDGALEMRKEYKFMRVETKVDTDGEIELLEIEQRPCGLGAETEAQRRYTGTWRSNILHETRRHGQIRLDDTVVLYSPGRATKEGACHSDDGIFAETIPWDDHERWRKAITTDTPVIIRSLQAEEVPAAVRDAFNAGLMNNLILPPHESEKYPVLKRYGAYRFIVRNLRETGKNIPGQVRDILTDMCNRHNVGSIVLKPDRGTRGFRVRRIQRGGIKSLNNRSSVLREIRSPYAGSLLAQPYVTGVGEEETGIFHVIRFFFLQTRRGEFHPLGGFLTLSDGHWVVHGGPDAVSCLLTVY